MGKIFCIMGKSGSGKDTILKELVEDKGLSLKPVISYTTRPIRHNEQNGIEYNFIDELVLKKYHAAGKVIERRDYNTINGIWSYCTIDDGQIDLQTESSYILILTLEAYKNLQHYFGSQHVVPIYIAVDDGIRLERAINREKQQSKPNYEEVCRRFLADSTDFSLSNLQFSNITKQYENENFKECLASIKTDMLCLGAL